MGNTLLVPHLVSIIVVTWNSAGHVPALAASLGAQTYAPWELVVVDNGSTDGGADFLAERFEGCTMIRNGENAGFARANNQGIAAARGAYVLLLNTDVDLSPDYVALLAGILDRDPRVGSCGGKLRRPPDPGGAALLDSAGEAIKRNRRIVNRGEGERDAGQYDRAGPVFGLTAAAALYRRSMLEDVRVGDEILDADYFAYLEDSDLNWRAQNRGWTAWFEPAAVATHARGHATSRDLAIRRHAHANRYLTIAKNDTVLNLLRDLPEILMYEAYRLGKTLAVERELLGGYALAISLMPRALAKRRQIQRARRAPSPALRAWFERDDYLGRLLR